MVSSVKVGLVAAFAVIGVVTLLGAVLYIRFKDLFTEKKEEDPS